MNSASMDPWSDFRTLTAARIALGHAGGSLPTRELLEFGLAHARARDAVLSPWDYDGFAAGLRSAGLQTLVLHSAAGGRDEYLRRPDLGRQLSNESRGELLAVCQQGPYDVSLIVSDGLSARATAHAADVVIPLARQLQSDGWSIAPVIVVAQARVAIQDEIGELVRSNLSLILLGERPGLAAPDSLGAYFVFGPRRGRTDADRNCVANIRPAGLAPASAVATLHYLLTASRHRKLSGVGLKDERLLSPPSPPEVLNRLER